MRIGYEAIVTPSASCAAMVREYHPELAEGDATLSRQVAEVAPRVHDLATFRLLRAVRGLELVDLPDARTCCGFGGTFAVKNPDVSAAMCADKVTAIRQSRAEIVTAGDNSCLMQIGGALSRMRTGVRAMHLAEILASGNG
jgi:L-lactate dehydrogenase complex protein LldE